MKGQQRKEISKRLSYVTGHIQGNRRMVEENKYCIDVVRQNQAAIATVNKINKIILQSHLKTGVAPAIESDVKSRKNKAFDEIAEIFEIEQKSQ